MEGSLSRVNQLTPRLSFFSQCFKGDDAGMEKYHYDENAMKEEEKKKVNQLVQLIRSSGLPHPHCALLAKDLSLIPL